MNFKVGMARKRKPSFFKVLIGDFSDQLRIPQAFNKHLDGRVPQQSRLRTAAGTWHVDVKSDNGRFILQKGWNNFVQDHGLRLGEFLVFRYAGNSIFFVDIYGRHGCKKQFLSRSEIPLEKRQDEEIHRTDDNSKQVGSSSTGHPNQNKDTENLEGSNGGYKACQETVFVKSEPINDDIELQTYVDVNESIRNMNARETLASQPREENPRQATALEAATKYTSKHPCCRVVLTETYVTKGILHLPSNFKKNIKKKKRTAKLQVSDRLWPVKWTNDSHSSRFSQGWNEFVRDNDLKVGDVCVLELVKQTDDVVLEVCFFRCCG